MAQFDVYRLDGGLVVDCQAERLDVLHGRLIIPLFPRENAPRPMQLLNPVFAIDGADYVLMTQAVSTVPFKLLGDPVASLAQRSIDITRALDMLISGDG